MDYWRILIEHFIVDADYIRIDCWNEEESVINELSTLCHELDKVSNNRMTIFTLLNNKTSVHEFIYNAFHPNRKLKWFSMFLIKDGQVYFSSEDYGNIFSMNGLTKDELNWVKHVMPKNFDIHMD